MYIFKTSQAIFKTNEDVFKTDQLLFKMSHVIIAQLIFNPLPPEIRILIFFIDFWLERIIKTCSAY